MAPPRPPTDWWGRIQQAALPYLQPGGERGPSFLAPAWRAGRTILAGMQQPAYLAERAVGRIAQWGMRGDPFERVTPQLANEAARITWSWLGNQQKMENVAGRLEAGEDVQNVLKTEQVTWRELAGQIIVDPLNFIGFGLTKARKARLLKAARVPKAAMKAEELFQVPGRVEQFTGGLFHLWRPHPRTRMEELAVRSIRNLDSLLRGVDNSDEILRIADNLTYAPQSLGKLGMTEDGQKLSHILRGLDINDFDSVKGLAKGIVSEGEEFRFAFLADVMDAAREFGRDVFKVPLAGPVEKFTRRLKDVMSLAFLGYNPGYLARNFFSGEVLPIIHGTTAWNTSGHYMKYASKFFGIEEGPKLVSHLRKLGVLRGIGAAEIGGIAARAPVTRWASRTDEWQGFRQVMKQTEDLMQSTWPKVMDELAGAPEGSAVLALLDEAQPGLGRAVRQTLLQAEQPGPALKQLVTRMLGGDPMVAQFTDDIGSLSPSVVARLQEALDEVAPQLRRLAPEEALELVEETMARIVGEGTSHARQVAGMADEGLEGAESVLSQLRRAQGQGVEIRLEQLEEFWTKRWAMFEQKEVLKEQLYKEVGVPEELVRRIGQLHRETMTSHVRHNMATWAQTDALRASQRSGWQRAISEIWDNYRVTEDVRFTNMDNVEIQMLQQGRQLLGRVRGAAAKKPNLPEIADVSKYEAGKVAKAADDLVRNFTIREGVELPGDLVKRTFAWLDGVVSPAFRETQDGVLQVGQRIRGDTLLDYGHRLYADYWLGTVFPYEFWYLHTGMNLLRSITYRPQMLVHYYRLKRALEETTSAPGFPQRLRGKVRIKLPFLPDWMGDELFWDPLRTLTPYPTFIEPYIPEDEEASRFEQYVRKVTGWVSPAPWLAWPALAMAGKETRERWLSGLQIPPLRYLRGLTGLAGIGPPGGVSIAPIRKLFGLPEQETWDPYRAERMVTSMAMTGELTDEEWREAMMGHRGPVWEEAVRRAAQERGITVTGQMAGISGLAIYPKGERERRRLTQELRQRIEKVAPGYYDRPFEERQDWASEQGYDEKISGVYRTFYDEHPEYEAWSMVWKDPRERVVAQIWDAYNEKSKAGKRQARADLGNKFATYFVNKAKRDYDRFTTEELTDIAERLGAEVGIARVAETEAELGRRPLIEPEAPSPYGEPPPPAGQVPTDIARDYDTFLNHRARNFPGIFTVQNQYFAFPQGSQQRRTFLAKHPKLKEYWEWARKFKADHRRFAAWYAQMTGQPAATTAAAAYAPYVPRPQVRVPWGGGGGGRAAPQVPQPTGRPITSTGPRRVQPRIGMPPQTRWYRRWR